MVNEEMARDLLGFRVPMLVLEDPFQLPPIKRTGFFTSAEPDAMLTEVHRYDGAVLELASRHAGIPEGGGADAFLEG